MSTLGAYVANVYNVAWDMYREDRRSPEVQEIVKLTELVKWLIIIAPGICIGWVMARGFDE